MSNPNPPYLTSAQLQALMDMQRRAAEQRQRGGAVAVATGGGGAAVSAAAVSAPPQRQPPAPAAGANSKSGGGGGAAGKAARASFETAATSPASDDEEDEDPYWEDPEWIPVAKSGKQRTPNQIRSELSKYIDARKRDSGVTQGSILEEMGVNSNSFRRFMNPRNYRDPWSACENGTYWAAARLLEEERHRQQKKKEAAKKKKNGEKKSGTGKRKAAPTGLIVAAGTSSSSVAPGPEKKAKGSKVAFQQLVKSIQYAHLGEVSEDAVFDSCPELVRKIRDFMSAEDGSTQKALCDALGIQAAQLGKFLLAKNQDAAGTVAYRRAWKFFEQKRLMDGTPKSQKRLKNEQEYPNGFPLEAPRGTGRRYRAIVLAGIRIEDVILPY